MAKREEKVELLRKVDIFSQLKEYELNVIANYSDFFEVKKGQAIFSQGSAANELYVVGSAAVGIISFEMDDARIAQITSSESFGEFDFLGRTVRSAAAFVEEDTFLLKFPSIKFNLKQVLLNTFSQE
jgi:CRP-like cAMP-binding protein